MQSLTKVIEFLGRYNQRSSTAKAFFFFCSVVFLQRTLFSGVEGIVLFPMAIHKKIVPLSFGC